MTIDEARAEFPVFERFAYLNAGTNGPLARPTIDAMIAQEQFDLEVGRGGADYFSGALGLRERVRAKLAAGGGRPRRPLSRSPPRPRTAATSSSPASPSAQTTRS